MTFSNAGIIRLAVHYVGNKSANMLHVTEHPIALDDVLSQKLEQYFLHPFTNNTEKYQFTHPSSLQYNEVYNYVNEIFSDPAGFMESTGRIARYLYEHSDHPKVKGGELYVAHFRNISVDERLLEGIGIFKSENKSGFFEVFAAERAFGLQYREGVPVNKPDKGCFIINDLRAPQLPVYIIDNQNKNEEAMYWKSGFLQVKEAADNYHYTKNFLSVAKVFITGQLSDREDITRMDQVNMLDQSVNYFKEKENFDIREFNESVFNDPQLIESFKEFGSNYIRQNDLQLSDQFEISGSAVKKQSRIFKSVLKLDRNFHIYIHGDKDLIEQGYDERTGKKFYKIYFDEER